MGSDQQIACTGGTPRNISQQTVEQSMARAWRRNFFAISQVSNTVFMAHFRTQEEMFWVFTRQPWAISSDNLLLNGLILHMMQIPAVITVLTLSMSQ
jgi:hypothetical protein